MRRFQNLLYVLNAQSDSNEGLKQAMSLARNNQAKLTVHIISQKVPDNYAQYRDSWQDAIKTQTTEAIEKLKSELAMSDFSDDIRVSVVNYNTESVGIIKSVLHHGFDMVIKDSSPVAHRSKGYNALDMNLLRDCPAAVWLCRPISNHRQDITVAVAVDPKQQEAEQTALSQSLLTMARCLADDCSKDLDIVSCRDNSFESELKDNVFIKISDDDIEKQISKEKQSFTDNLDTLIASSNVSVKEAEGRNNIQILAGKPDKQIPQFVTEQNIDILVMGTVARTGISGFFIGNTAENIMQQLNCSLLAIKPKGFVSSVKL
jgi:nucleotide-binding universal stress UspA family protein